MSFLAHLFGTRADRDGQAPALEAEAGLFDATRPAPASDTGTRRDRGFGRPQDLIHDSLSLKVLDGWLQNRHQILVPLAFRLDRLPPDHLALLMDVAAFALLNASAGDERAVAAGERWLGTANAPAAAVEAFRAAIQAPKPLNRLLEAVRAEGLEPYAYAVTVAMADTRDAAGHLLSNYMAARLALPADAIRSIDRRFRR